MRTFELLSIAQWVSVLLLSFLLYSWPPFLGWVFSETQQKGLFFLFATHTLLPACVCVCMCVLFNSWRVRVCVVVGGAGSAAMVEGGFSAAGQEPRGRAASLPASDLRRAQDRERDAGTTTRMTSRDYCV